MISTLLRAVLVSLLPFGGIAIAGEANGLDVSRDDVRTFIASMVKQHGFKADELTAVLGAAQPQPRILEIIQRPAEHILAWWEYRDRLVTAERIDRGVKVWQANRDVLDRISASTGVPAEYLIAITGIETTYGLNTGRYRVLDALTTLGFNYPPRADFFQRELEQFLLLTREDHVDPRTPLGSYAGAMGIALFMPSSMRSYAVDESHDGHRDLASFGPDVFASIANYFVKHGWSPGQPVLAEATNSAAPDDPASAKLTLTETVAGLRGRGYVFDSTLPEDTKVMLVPAQLADQLAWRVGFQNFYVITRYNHSSLYAMAVHDLATAIARRYQATTP